MNETKSMSTRGLETSYICTTLSDTSNPSIAFRSKKNIQFYTKHNKSKNDYSPITVNMYECNISATS